MNRAASCSIPAGFFDHGSGGLGAISICAKRRSVLGCFPSHFPRSQVASNLRPLPDLTSVHLCFFTITTLTDAASHCRRPHYYPTVCPPELVALG